MAGICHPPFRGEISHYLIIGPMVRGNKQALTRFDIIKSTESRRIHIFYRPEEVLLEKYRQEKAAPYQETSRNHP